MWSWALDLASCNLLQLCIVGNRNKDEKFVFPDEEMFDGDPPILESFFAQEPEQRSVRMILSDLLHRQWNTDYRLCLETLNQVKTVACQQWERFFAFRQQLKKHFRRVKSALRGRRALRGTEVLESLQSSFPFVENYVCNKHGALEHHFFISHRKFHHGMLTITKQIHIQVLS